MKERKITDQTDKKILKYLKQFKTQSIKDLTLEEGNCLFIKIIDDFKKNKLTLDDLSFFGSKIFHGIAKNKGVGSDLFFTSLSAMDLSFEIRNLPQNVPQHLNDINDFFQKYQKE